MSNTRKPRSTKAKAKVLDFDALAKKKAATRGELPKVKVGGKTYTLPPVLPLAVTDYFTENAKAEDENVKVRLDDMKELLEILLGEDQWAEVRRVLDIALLPDFFSQVIAAYGESVGESSASGAS